MITKLSTPLGFVLLSAFMPLASCSSSNLSGIMPEDTGGSGDDDPGELDPGDDVSDVSDDEVPALSEPSADQLFSAFDFMLDLGFPDSEVGFVEALERAEDQVPTGSADYLGVAAFGSDAFGSFDAFGVGGEATDVAGVAGQVAVAVDFSDGASEIDITNLAMYVVEDVSVRDLGAVNVNDIVLVSTLDGGFSGGGTLIPPNSDVGWSGNDAEILLSGSMSGELINGSTFSMTGDLSGEILYAVTEDGQGFVIFGAAEVRDEDGFQIFNEDGDSFTATSVDLMIDGEVVVDYIDLEVLGIATN